MKPRRGDHVVFDCRKSEIRCEHCGQRYKPNLPAPVTVFLAMARAFINTHRHCRRHAEPHASPHP